ncbi:hypothetical protein CMO88_00635 [Candidatus Woesearchaeota archaeon]|nr:hypothetical protein [Candidatus Woesearchaeota archaeon]|tara:strand:- start:10110 stop:10688 length:579 start_codon:yes stop_codon:yes gene_type:complete
MANEFPEFFVRLDQMGVLDSLLPFILIFTILFAVLQKTKIIGEGKRQFNTLVALIISLMVVLPHVTGRYPPGQDIVSIINTALPQVSLLVVAILAALLLVGVFAPGVMLGGTGLGAIMGLISLGAIVYIFGNAAGFWKGSGAFNFLNNPDTQAVLVIILVFGLIIWFITKEDGQNEMVGKAWSDLKSTFGRG